MIFSEMLRQINRGELYLVNLQPHSRISGKDLVLGLSTGKLTFPQWLSARARGCLLLSGRPENLPRNRSSSGSPREPGIS